MTNTEQKIPEHKTQKQTEGENFKIFEIFLRKNRFFYCEKNLKSQRNLNSRAFCDVIIT